MINSLIEEIYNQTSLDWSILATAIIYVVLAARENAWCWAWGVISCSLLAYADFTKYNLQVDGYLQIFYVGMGIWGLYSWKFSKGKNKDLPISKMHWKEHLAVIAVGLLLTSIWGYIFSRFTDTALPYPDSFITAFSVLATFLTVRKKLENWLYWIVVDTLAIFLFASRGAALVAVVMGAYTFIATVGYFHWRNRWKTKATATV